MNHKTILIAIVYCIFFSLNTFSQTSSYEHVDWQNQAVFGINKLPARNSAWPCPDATSALQSNYDQSPWLLSLNGLWSFNFAPDPDHRPADFYLPGFNARAWKKIPVPSCWELEGLKVTPVGQSNYGIPIYTNSNYPFSVKRIPYVMDEPNKKFSSYTQRNPVGSYIRHFKIPANWAGGRTLIHFAGVSSAMYIWVNGHKVGYSENSRVPAEFDISAYLKSGDNLLAVEVYRYSDGSYLEDQDMWRLSGIFRDVFLYHTPALSIWDFYVHAPLDSTLHNADLSLRYTLRNNTVAANARIRVYLHALGSKITPRLLIDEPVKTIASGMNAERITASVKVKNPLLWTSETPNLYDVVVELVQDGKVTEARRIDLGFRKIYIRDKQLFINGRSVKIKGVNRHESDPSGGYTITRASMIKDIRLIKQANLNFVRNSHYPNSPRWYELCNRYGLFLMDENNLETHGLSYHKRVLPGDDKTWEPAVLDRMERMVVTDRNNPSVVSWSLGNEAGYGNAFMAMRELTRAKDPQLRPIHYADMNLAADFDSQTYPTTEWLVQHVNNKAVRKGEQGQLGTVAQHGPYPSGKPFLANEYAHAQANSLGNLQDYWDVFEKYPMLLGGFIWEWADQTLYKIDDNGRRFMAYGGDFGDQPNDNFRCVKGLVSAERVPRPHYWEGKKVFQYIKVTADDVQAGRVRIRNKYFFTDLHNYSAEWLLEENGKVIAQNKLVLPVLQPGEEKSVTIPWGNRTWKAGKEYFLTIKFRLRVNTLWANAGHIVAWDQLAVPVPPLPGATKQVMKVNLVNDMSGYTATCGKTIIKVNAQGWLSSFLVNGKENLARPLKPNFWRVPTDNDLGWQVPRNMGAWKGVMDKAKLQSLEGEVVADGARITAVWNLPIDSTYTRLVYLLKNDGQIKVELYLKMGRKAPEIPRIGFTFGIPADQRHIDWYGRGPQENYRDRKTGAAVGLYQANLSDWITHYVRPQDNSNRTDVRWIGFKDVAGAGLQVKAANDIFGVTAWPYTQEDLETTLHDYRLPHRDFITVNIDGFQMGVGGDISWGLPVHEEYRILKKGEYKFAVELNALSK